MTLRLLPVFLALLIASAGCGTGDSTADAREKRGTGAREEISIEDHDAPASIPLADPRFSAHFTAPFYDDLDNESAPFGSDEGFDMLFVWAERRDELGPDGTVADVLEGDPAEYVAADDYDSAVAVVSAGFTLLRLTGQIDPDGLALTIAAVDQMLAMFGEDPLLLEQRADLVAWRG